MIDVQIVNNCVAVGAGATARTRILMNERSM